MIISGVLVIPLLAFTTSPSSAFVVDRVAHHIGTKEQQDVLSNALSGDEGKRLLQQVYPNCNVTYLNYIGDGQCDLISIYNTAACGWDGGDCCEETCVKSSEGDCPLERMECRDPKVLYYPDCTALLINIGDGFCDNNGQNSYECGWDGGDCCEESCQPGLWYTCNATLAPFRCRDPRYISAPTEAPSHNPSISKKPSKSPSKSPVTTLQPTPFPVTPNPTNKTTPAPTTSSPTTPTISPILTPATSNPTMQPVTSRPSLSPSLTPSSSSPTIKPIASKPPTKPTPNAIASSYTTQPVTSKPTTRRTPAPPTFHPTMQPVPSQPTSSPTSTCTYKIPTSIELKPFTLTLSLPQGLNVSYLDDINLQTFNNVTESYLIKFLSNYTIPVEYRVTFKNVNLFLDLKNSSVESSSFKAAYGGAASVSIISLCNETNTTLSNSQKNYFNSLVLSAFDGDQAKNYNNDLHASSEPTVYQMSFEGLQ